MALQQFVKQIKGPALSQDEPTSAVAQNSSAMPAETDAAAAKPFDNTAAIVAEAAIISSKHSGSHDNADGKPPVLREEDCETLSALAAIQIKYGRPAEAIPYLMMLRRNNPADAEVARLLALALMKMGHWQQAEIIMDDLHGGPTTNTSSSFLLLRSIAAFKQRKLDAARTWLQRFREYVAGSAA